MGSSRIPMELKNYHFLTNSPFINANRLACQFGLKLQVGLYSME
jgi:hypothetical protein